ncbi:MAG: alkaline phosphatase family protein [Candidatus Marinimicrobia bacterium]|nr:alkaline phosphatase family protein [Candidatus Neomarinimicrobiota bacterium]MCF7827445.1 alkaline phosphatase family protein [Candidatus Neomarinimicrobiota bacterium]MCF7882320.1 alkaline phosphatase family protein [Candidatus Neomarinimicrobiota bacterium]
MPDPEFLVIGLDGLPYSLLADLCQSGVTPNLNRLIQAGHSASINSSIPDVSSTAWASFMTGTNPGTHGVYGFFEARSDNYSLHFLDSNDIKAPTLWERLSDSRKKSLVINVPQTYPAREVDGVLISGFVTPDLQKAVWPKSLLPALKDLDYSVDVDAWLAREDMDKFMEDLFRVLERRVETIHYLWDRESWDIIMAVFTGTDRLQHYLWDAVVDEGHQYHAQVMEFYHILDGAVGTLTDKAGEDTGIIILSDHGFTGIEKELNLNAWLQIQGYLEFTTESPESLEDMAPESIAFALDPGRIYLNRSGRFRHGWIEDGDEFRKYRDELRIRLADEIRIRDDAGNMVNPIEKVYLPEEIYSGPELSQAPDLIVLNNPGFDLKGSVKIDTVARRDVLTGTHTYRDATLIGCNLPDNFDFNAIESIEDITPKILAAMNAEI